MSRLDDLIYWTISQWQQDDLGAWSVQPVILVAGYPFTYDHPQGYIDKLQALHDDPGIMRGPFHRTIGEFRDCLENTWNILEIAIQDEKSPYRNGDR